VPAAQMCCVATTRKRPPVRRVAPIHLPDHRPERTTVIAATASVHGVPVVIRNVRDLQAIAMPSTRGPR
jgi:predicted nucleic acid-binding protein